MNRLRIANIISLLALLIVLVTSCKQPYAPKPRSYFRIEFPAKEYQEFESECAFRFEYPVYGAIEKTTFEMAGPCWYNLVFSNYRATVHLTYKPVDDDLSSHIEDVRRIVYKHIIKADDIIESRISIDSMKVYGLIYDIKGNAASSVNFYITDSTSGFLSGSLYFNVSPNRDSLAPAIQFFREDIVHLIESFSWE